MLELATPRKRESRYYQLKSLRTSQSLQTSRCIQPLFRDPHRVRQVPRAMAWLAAPGSDSPVASERHNNNSTGASNQKRIPAPLRRTGKGATRNCRRASKSWKWVHAMVCRMSRARLIASRNSNLLNEWLIPACGISRQPPPYRPSGFRKWRITAPSCAACTGMLACATRY